MKLALTKRVQAAWLLIVVVAGIAVVVLWKVAILDAPPSNAVLITSSPNGAQPLVMTQATPLSSTAARVSLNASPSPTELARMEPSPKAQPDVSAPSTTEVPTASAETAATTVAPAPTPLPDTITVYVSGAVKRAGVYTLTLGSRLGDALQEAGGAATNADLDQVNLAVRLADEEHVLVPRKGDTPVPVSGVRAPTSRRSPTQVRTPGSHAQATAHTAGGATPASGPKPTPAGNININTASVKELGALPGIGPVLAARIVAYRTANGSFQTPEDLMRVPGIKEGLYAKVKDHIIVGP